MKYFLQLIQDDSRGKDSILGGGSIGRSDLKKSSYEYMSNSNWLRKTAVRNFRPKSVRICFWGWMKSEVYTRKMERQDELLARILDAAVCIQRREDPLRVTKRDLRTRVAKCTEVDGAGFQTFIVITKL